MKIGIIDEGQSEHIALAKITDKIKIDDIQILRPIYTCIEPKCSPKQIVKAAEEKIKILRTKKVDKIILLLDLETSQTCPGLRASTIKEAARTMGHLSLEVVIKNRKFENWLVADPEAIQKLNYFEIPKSFVNKVINNKADTVEDAVDLLKKCKKNKYDFDKTKDAIAISSKCNPYKIAQNSRSFRKFLRELNHPKFKSQSRKPL